MSAMAVLNDMAGGVTVTIDEPGMEKKRSVTGIRRNDYSSGRAGRNLCAIPDIDVSQSALGRMDRHREYAGKWMAQAAEKQRQDSQFLGNVFNSIQSYMVTNLNKDEYLDAGLAVMQTEGILNGDYFFTVPGEGMEGVVYDEFYPDKEALEEMIIELFYKEL